MTELTERQEGGGAFDRHSEEVVAVGRSQRAHVVSDDKEKLR